MMGKHDVQLMYIQICIKDHKITEEDNVLLSPWKMFNFFILSKL